MSYYAHWLHMNDLLTCCHNENIKHNNSNIQEHKQQTTTDDDNNIKDDNKHMTTQSMQREEPEILKQDLLMLAGWILDGYWKSLMGQWLKSASQGHIMHCHDLEVMGSNPGWVEIGGCTTSV